MPTRVWIIDDCPLSTRFTRGRLVAIGAEVSVFPSARTAIAAFNGGAEPPSLIVMDLHMNEIEGLEAGGILRDAGYLGSLILHTAEIKDEHRARLRELGFDGFLAKPATKQQLTDLVRAAADRRAA